MKATALIDRAGAQLLRKQRLDRPQDAVEAAEQIEPAPALMRRLGGHSDRMRRLQEQLVDADAADVFRARLQRRQHHQRHDRGARPVGNLVEVERRPHRQQHDLDRQYRHAAPGQHPEHRQHETREDIAVDGAAARADRLARPHHVRRVGGIADHLQREIGLHAGAHVESAVMHQRPAAMGALNPAQVIGDLAFQHGVDGLAEIVAKQHIFRRDGAIGFQFEHPVSVRLPEAEQRPASPTRCSPPARRRVPVPTDLLPECMSLDIPVLPCPVSPETGMLSAHGSGLAAWRGRDRRRGRPTAPIPRWWPATPYQSSRRQETGFCKP